MIAHRQAKVVILLALASATLLCVVLECRAAEGGQDGHLELERAKKQWEADFFRQTKSPYEDMEALAELLRQLQTTMPQDDKDYGWKKRQAELARLIDVASVDKECDVAKMFPKHKQAEACASKIGEQAAKAAANLSEDDKHAADVLGGYVPPLRMGFFLGYLDTFENTKEELAESIYKFLAATQETSGSLYDLNKAEFYALFDTRMKLCERVDEIMQKALDDYFEICTFDKRFADLIEPEKKKWIRVAFACRRIKKNEPDTRSLVYEEFKRARPSMDNKSKSKIGKLANCFVGRSKRSKQVEE